MWSETGPISEDAAVAVKNDILTLSMEALPGDRSEPSRACKLFNVSAASMSSCDMPDSTLAARVLLSSPVSRSIALLCDVTGTAENGGGPP